MKILLVAHESTLGGATHSLLDIIKELEKKGYEVYVILPKPLRSNKAQLIDILKKNNIRCTEYYYGVDKLIATKTKNKVKNFIFYIMNIITRKEYELERLMAKNFDIIHTNSSVVELGKNLAEKYKIPHIWHVRENVEVMFGKTNQELTEWYEKVFESNSKFIFITEQLRKEYEELSKKNNFDCCVIYNGIDFSKISTAKTTYQEKKIVISCFGRIQKTKGQIDLVKAATILKEKDVNFEINFVGDQEKKYFEEILELCQQNNLEDRVNFLGYIKDTEQIRCKTEVEVLCSINEAFGRVIIEGMASKSIVVGTNNGGPREIMSNEVNGFLYNPGEHEELSNILLKIYKMSNLEKKMIINNASMEAKKYSIDKCVDEIIKVYNKELSL